MITTTEIRPAAVLAPFVRCYRYREFDTKGTKMIVPWFAYHEMVLTFHFKDWPVASCNPFTGQMLTRGNYGGLLGLGTQYNGEIIMNGRYAFLEIVFRPGGLYTIFRLAAKEITNHIIFVDDLFDPCIKLFYEQLCTAGSLADMGILTNTYLQLQLKKQRIDYDDMITACSHIISHKRGKVTVQELSAHANMSMRNFERRFIEQTGVSPKMLCCTTRFNHALSLKLDQPAKQWTSIGYEAGYFDQMHLIKDFKRFSGATPFDFMQQTPLSLETFTSRVEG